MRRRDRRPLRWIVGCALACAFVLGACDTPSARVENRPAGTSRFAIFGDSVALETLPYLQQELAARNETIAAAVRGGTAPCDWIDDFHRVVTSGRFDDVVVLFVGNRWTPCAQPLRRAPSVNEAVATYRRDLAELVRSAAVARTRIHIVLPPPIDPAQHPDWAELSRRIADDIARPIVARYPFTADTWSLEPAFGTTYATRDRCRADEADLCSPDGTVQLRTSDGIHLCPIDAEGFMESGGVCPRPSPGARRLARLLSDRLVDPR